MSETKLNVGANTSAAGPSQGGRAPSGGSETELSVGAKTSWRIRGMAIKHGDTLYAEGDLIDLSEQEAKPLLAWLEAVEPDAKPSVSLAHKNRKEGA